jgi:hypothetical protein
MKRSREILPALFLLWFSVPDVMANEPPSSIPQEIAARNQARKAPIWVSAEKVAAEPDSKELFSPSNNAALRRHQQKQTTSGKGSAVLPDSYLSLISEGICKEFFAAPEIQRSDIKPHWTYADVVRHADSILAGRIEAIEVGFLDGVPGSLLRIDVSREVHRAEDVAPGRHIYLYYPYATFQIAGTAYCTKDGDFPHRPRVGEDILIFNFYPSVDAHGTLIYTHAEGLFFEDSAGLLVIPPRLRQDRQSLPADNLEGLVDNLRASRS